jgi:hypothetical protein
VLGKTGLPKQHKKAYKQYADCFLHSIDALKSKVLVRFGGLQDTNFAANASI